MDGRTAEVDTLPGQKQVRRFFGDRQREQLAEIVRAIIQQPVNVRLAEIAPPKQTASEATAADATHPGSNGLSPDRQARKDAMESPAVKQIIDMFDARLIKTYTVKSEEVHDPDSNNSDAPNTPQD